MRMARANMSSILPLLLLLLLSSAYADDDAAWRFDDFPRAREIHTPDWFKQSFLDLPADLEEALEADKRGIAVYFGQQNCAYCEALMEVNFGERDITEYTRRHFDIIALDIWGSRTVVDINGDELSERTFAVREGTNFTPSLIFYDHNGEEALRLRGYYPPYRFRAALEYVVDGHYQSESFRDYLARADPPPKFDVGDLNDAPFFAPPPHLLARNYFPAEQPLVVFFERRECHACDVLHSDTLWDSEALTMIEQFEAVQLDMDSDQPVWRPDGKRSTAREWAAELELFYAPTLLFFDERGREIIRVDSVVRLYRLKGVLEYLLAKGYQETPSYLRWRRQQSERLN